MSEVLKSNFKELFKYVENSLKKSAFVAIDSEFSGLVSHARLKNSLFDTSDERYVKLKCSIEQFTVFQFGLSVFHYDRDGNKYVADVYSFYALPCAFGPMDSRFLCQASSWDFLTAHNFNFNQVAYHGIPFLNSVQEAEIKQQLRAGTMFSNMERSLSYRDEDELQASCSRVAQWLPGAAEGDQLAVQLEETRHCLVYFTHKEIRCRFQDLWTYQEPDKIIVRKLTPADVTRAREAEGDELDRVLLDNLLGLSKVFRLLVDLKKPIVGHNLLLDLMILYNLMYEPLPNTYKQFKKQLHSMFPAIYDTKFISYRVKDLLKKQECWESNALDQLYVFLTSEKEKRLAILLPKVELMDVDPDNPITGIETLAHEAAWDAFMSGVCFIKLAHYMACRRYGENFLPRPLVRIEAMAAVEEYKNRLNLIRGSVSHMNIGGEEPPSNRPKLLYLTRSDRKVLNLDQVTVMMASHGNVDVKAVNEYTCLIAVPNKNSARDIVKMFMKEKTYKVVPYSTLRHNPIFNTVLWGGIVLSTTCLTVFLVTSVVKK